MSRILYVCEPEDTTLIPVGTLTMRDKPPVVCPICREPVTIVAAPKRPVFARHRSKSVCSTIRPESAAHDQTKRMICTEIGMDYIPTGRSLTVYGPNGSWRTIQIQPDYTAQVEVPLRGIRFDVGLLNGGGLPVLGIEVKDTHGVSPQKAALLQRLGIPWIEVQVGASLNHLTALNWSY